MEQERNYFRVDTLMLVRFSDGEDSSPLNQGYIADLSAGGMLIHAYKKVSAGTIINLAFNLPSRKIVGDLQGKVIRVERILDIYKIAIEFINILEHNQDIIVKYLFDLQIMLRKVALEEEENRFLPKDRIS